MGERRRFALKRVAPGGAPSHLRRRLVPYALLAPGTIWLLLFFAIPMYFMGEMSLRSGIPNTPEGFTFSWEFSNYSEALEGRGEQIIRTSYYAEAATIFALLIAYPLAYAIALKVSSRWRLLLLFAVIAPFLTTYLIRTIAWETILAEASKDLYASARQAFLRVTLPLTMPGVVAGVLLTFIPAFGDYVNAEFLGGASNTMIGNKIQSTYLEESNYPEAASLSFLMMAAVLITVLIYIRLAGTEAFVGEEDER